LCNFNIIPQNLYKASYLKDLFHNIRPILVLLASLMNYLRPLYSRYLALTMLLNPNNQPVVK